MAFQPRRGATLLIPSGPSGSHLFVVATDEMDGQFLLVSISSIKPNRYHDPTCEIAAGVHEFVTKDSFGYYRDARIEKCTRLIALEANGYFFAKADMPMEVVQNLCDGIEQSTHTARYVLDFYRRYLDTLN